VSTDGVGQVAAGTAVRVRVPAKINLFLAVRGVRDDGYHELVTVLQTIGLHDELTLRLDGPAMHPAARRFMEVTLRHDAGPGVPDGPDNLVVRAARLLLAHLTGGHEPHGAEGVDTPVTAVELRKRIPVAAGMAGGSADAAGVLVGLNELWDAGLDRGELRALAADLGADVPFCVAGGTALATGNGTATAQVLTRGQYHWVVGMSDEPLSTPAVYRAFDEVGTPSEVEPDVVLQALRTGDAEVLGAALHNDLEVAAVHLRPELADHLDALRAAGALGAIVSGSGPTVIALAPSAAAAHEIAAATQHRFHRVAVSGSPAGGPEVRHVGRAEGP
jgi:4-diphosphocytidyl-2-C-methyl-D-erythritol kinase